MKQSKRLRGSLLALAAVGVCALAASAPAKAHEQAIGFTELTFIADAPDGDCVQDGCRFEIAHRLVIHDAESTLMNVLGARADLVSDPAAQSRFEAYVADRFQLVDAASGAPIALTLLGGEVERGYYWVYQEGRIEPGQSELLVTQSVLMDAIAKQTNRVNVKYRETLETFVFNSGTGVQRYAFEP